MHIWQLALSRQHLLDSVQCKAWHDQCTNMYIRWQHWHLCVHIQQRYVFTLSFLESTWAPLDSNISAISTHSVLVHHSRDVLPYSMKSRGEKTCRENVRGGLLCLDDLVYLCPLVRCSWTHNNDLWHRESPPTISTRASTQAWNLPKLYFVDSF